MKKILSAFILIIFVFSFSGCGSSSQSSNQNEAETNNNELNTNQTENSNEIKLKIAVETESDSMDSAENEEAETKLNSASVMPMTVTTTVSDELDNAVGEAVINNNDGSYLDGECNAEGHIILKADESKSNITLYTLTTYGEYGFQNGMFIKVSGTGVIPVVITFSVDKDNTYILQSYIEPKDGSGYATSIKEMFPKELYNRVIPISDSDKAALQAQERKYAKNYLDSIGRTASIGEYTDLEIEIPDIPADTANVIFKRYWEYPYWIGTEEKIEDGVRYVYETQWKNYGNNDSMIYLTKYVYDTGEIIRTINVHIDDGEVQSTEEKVLKLVENSKQ